MWRTCGRLAESLQPAAPVVAVAAADASEKHEDRGDDGDDDGQAEHEAEPVDESGEQYADDDSDHGRRSTRKTSEGPRLPCVAPRFVPSRFAAARSPTAATLRAHAPPTARGKVLVEAHRPVRDGRELRHGVVDDLGARPGDRL